MKNIFLAVILILTSTSAWATTGAKLTTQAQHIPQLNLLVKT